MSERDLNGAMERVRRFVVTHSLTGLSDGALVARFAERHDEAAFAELVERHGPMVLGVCRRVLRHGADAEDAFQAAFLLLAHKAAAVRKRESVGSWLHGAAYRMASNLRRARQRRQQREQVVPSSPDELTPADDASWREVRAVIDTELAGLPEHLRSPLVLCYLEGRTRDEAAQALGWTLSTFRGRLERGRELLRRRLEARGLGLPAALLATLIGAGGPVPTALAADSLAAVTALAAGRGLADVVSFQAVNLLHGAIQAMFLTRLALFGIAIVAVLVCAGTGAIGWHVLAQAPEPKPASAQPAPPKSRSAPDGAPEPKPPALARPTDLDRFKLRVVLYPPSFVKPDVDTLELHVLGKNELEEGLLVPGRALITKEQAESLLITLFKDGFGEEAQQNDGYKGPHIWLEISYRPAESTERQGYGISLRWEPPAIRRLEKLRASVTGEAGKVMDSFLAPLVAWARQQKEEASPPAADPSAKPDRTPAAPLPPRDLLQVELRGKLLREDDKYRMAVRSPDPKDRFSEDVSGWGPMKLELVLPDDGALEGDDHLKRAANKRRQQVDEFLKRLEGKEVLARGLLRVRPPQNGVPPLSMRIDETTQVHEVEMLATLNLPQNDVMQSVIQAHKEVKRDTLLMTWFTDERPAAAMQCRADLAAAKVTTFAEVFNFAIQDTKTRALSDAQVDSLRNLIGKLPPSTEGTSVKWLLLISAQVGGQPKTHAYDRRKLPAEIQRLYDLTGASIDDKEPTTP